MRTTNSKSKEKDRLKLADVARASGFSPATVSIVLNEAPLSRHIAKATKKKIQETARTLGYRPDVFARSLRNQRSQTIGILVIDLADPFCTLILQGIERRLMGTPYLPIIMDVCNQTHEVDRYLRLMVERRVEGLMVLANWMTFEPAVLAEMADRQVPTIVIGRDSDLPAIGAVAVDNERGGSAAMEHLYHLGHRAIAVIRGPHRLRDSRLRWKGIRRFAQKVRLKLDPGLTVVLPDGTESSSSFEGARRLTEDLIRSGKSFTAILAFDDNAAYGAMRALYEAGIRVPEQCSVIGFDDVPAASITSPALTTIRQPMMAMGEYATDYILAHLDKTMSQEERDRTYVENKTMAPQLLVRGSTAVCPPGTSLSTEGATT
jgi:LacI family transcriptional regulator